MPLGFTSTIKMWEGEVSVDKNGFPDERVPYLRYSNSCREVWLGEVNQTLRLYSGGDELRRCARTFQIRVRLNAQPFSLFTHIERDLNKIYKDSFLRFEQRPIRIWSGKFNNAAMSPVASIESATVEALSVAWWAILLDRLLACQFNPSPGQSVLQILEASNMYDEDAWFSSSDRENHITLWKNIDKLDPCGIAGWSGMMRLMYSNNDHYNPPKLSSVVDYITKKRLEYFNA